MFFVLVTLCSFSSPFNWRSNYFLRWNVPDLLHLHLPITVFGCPARFFSSEGQTLPFPDVFHLFVAGYIFPLQTLPQKKVFNCQGETFVLYLLFLLETPHIPNFQILRINRTHFTKKFMWKIYLSVYSNLQSNSNFNIQLKPNLIGRWVLKT